MRIAKALLDELVAHVVEDPENEICGVLAVEADGSMSGHARAVRVYRAQNTHASPLRFEIDGNELLGLTNTIEARGWQIGAIYHSHVRSEPRPSQTDINYARLWPGVEWIIVGLGGEGEPEVRSYLIDGGEVQEVPLEVG
jgi:proteasome lid subunit RPN8/RPN11